MHSSIESCNVKNFQVIRMSNKSLVLLVNGEQVFATKRVANLILSGEKELFFIETLEDGQKWLSYPSRF